MITLCEECFPDYGNHEIKTMVPIDSCASCGRYNQHRTDGLKCYVFGHDPRKSKGVVIPISIPEIKRY